MLSKPVVGFTSHSTTPETVPPQDFQTSVNHPQHTMRFRKCHGFAEPVDVTKAVPAHQSALWNGAKDSMPSRHAGVGDYS
ncbi:MAG TPA: hypothetical protein VJT11_12610 [Nitrospiraceae bacterium]|nr:hypothetical protein [Nitrospiraceae bacterium]